MTPPARSGDPDLRPVVKAPLDDRFDEILTPGALDFLGGLAERFTSRIDERLAARAARRERWLRGERLRFLPETASVREGDWTVAPLPDDILRRVIEITGPVDRKMVINALNSGADVYMADFEDSSAPTWANVIGGQINLHDAVRRTITFDDAARGKHYELGETVATLMVRPRGLHLVERHITHGGRALPGSLVDFGLFLFHNGRALVDTGAGPYFYLAKLESHLEARLWNDVFLHAQDELGLPRGTIKATVLIETLPAAFEMDEILYELREHSAGLNCGRWDYIFSAIKTRRHDPDAVLPDRSQVTMTQPFMRAYTQLVVRTCHRRRVHAMGGMAAQIPISTDPEANEQALAKVRADKNREAEDGHDGTWVAHPGLVALARDAFEARLEGRPNQLDTLREDVSVSADDLLAVPDGTRTEEGLRLNVRVGIRYLEAWLRGTGCVPLYWLMEDAATAEISRAQVWQQLRHAARLDDGRTVDEGLVRTIIEQELERIRGEVGDQAFTGGRFPDARELFESLCFSDDLVEFLTLPAYDLLEPPSRGR